MSRELQRAIGEVRQVFAWLLDAGFAIASTSELPMGDWSIVLQSSDHSIVIHTDRGELNLGFAPLVHNMRDEIGIRAMIFYLTGGADFIGRFPREVERNRRRSLEHLAGLLAKYHAAIAPFFGLDYDKYRFELHRAQQQYVDKFIATYLPPVRPEGGRPSSC